MMWTLEAPLPSTLSSTPSCSRWGTKDPMTSESYKESFRRRKLTWGGSKMFWYPSTSSLITGCLWILTCPKACLKYWTQWVTLSKALSTMLTSFGNFCKTTSTLRKQSLLAQRSKTTQLCGKYIYRPSHLKLTGAIAACTLAWTWD